MRKSGVTKFLLLWAIVLLILLSACGSGESNIDRAKFDEVSKVLQTVPIHPSKSEIETINQFDGSKISIIRKYKSDAAFDEVKEFYLKQLNNQGWQLKKEEELKDKGRVKNERALHFTRGELLLSVQFAGERKDVLGWDYAIRIAYPSDWEKKI